MSEVLLFLGAGASSVFRVPTMKKFVNELSTRIPTDHPSDSALYSDVLKKLREVFGDSLDLEAVLDTISGLASQPSTANLFRGTSPHHAYRFLMLNETDPERLGESLKSVDERVGNEASSARELLDFCTDQVLKICRGADEELATATYQSFLGTLAGSPCQDGMGVVVPTQWLLLSPAAERPYLTVATTNYDTAFESYCIRSAVEYTDGFHFGGGERSFEFDATQFDHPRGIPILKLHGSVDWWKTDKKRVVENRHTRLGDRLANGEVATQPCIRYPISDKQLFEYPFLELYSRFARYLQESRIWIFIGYSFGDPSIRNLVIDLARRNKKLIVVHPEASNILQQKLAVVSRVPSYPVEMRFPHNYCLRTIQEAFKVRPDEPLRLYPPPRL